MSLREYNRKRKFDHTPEPKGKPELRRGDLRFVVQLHRATRLHFDFRIEMGGVFKSWAVPRGPSLNPMDQRLAVFVEDHPIAYGSFEGIIPRGNYGAGTVMIWDQGTYRERGNLDETGSSQGEKAMLEGLESGHMTFVLEGEKLRGEFALIRLDKNGTRNEKGDDRSWLLVKKRDEHSTYKIAKQEEPRSVVSGRTITEITAQAEKQGALWLPKRTVSSHRRKNGSNLHRSNAPRAEAPTKNKVSQIYAPPPKPRASTKPVEKITPTARKTGADRMLRRVHPMLARVAKSELKQSGWLFCGLTGGLRAIAEVEGKRANLYSKSHLSFNRKFPVLIEALEQANFRAVLDGEIAADGGSYRIFDLLYSEGKDLRALPLEERLKILSKLDLPGSQLVVCEQKKDNGSGLLKKKGFSSVLARDANSEYHSGVSPHWLKVRDIGTQPLRATSRTASHAPSPKKSKGSPSREVIKIPETPKKTAAVAALATAHGPAFTHLTKVYWKKERITKGDLIEYYRQIAPVLLPHLEGRPMSLHRFPGGIDSKGFYQKDFTGYKPRFIGTHRLYSESAGKSVDYVVCQNEATLLYLANLGCIEMNPWLSRTTALERPDWLVIDLDPDRQTYEQVVTVGLEVRRVLEKIGAPSLCKTSGATGMHICVPLGAHYEYELARDFAEKICATVQAKMPELTTLERNPSRRGGRMYLDFMQNRIGQTLASPYSVRPRPGAPVSTPLKWSEVTRKLDPSTFTIHTTLKRLERVGDLWAPVLREHFDIQRGLKRLLQLSN